MYACAYRIFKDYDDDAQRKDKMNAEPYDTIFEDKKTKERRKKEVEEYMRLQAQPVKKREPEPELGYLNETLKSPNY